MTQRADELRAAGIDVLALTIDGVQNSQAEELVRARELLAQWRFPFETGRAAYETIDKLTTLQRPFVEAKLNTLPTSLLISADGSLEAVYKGPLNLDTVLRDAQRVAGAGGGTDLAIEMPGRWFARPTAGKRDELITIGSHFLLGGYLDDAETYYRQALAIDAASELAQSNLKIVDTQREELREGIRLHEQRLAEDDSAENHYNLAVFLSRAHRAPQALRHFRAAAERGPGSAQVHVGLARLLTREGELDEAQRHARLAERIAPDDEGVKQLLVDIEAARRGTAPQ